jgi:hypothetical protein
LSINIKELLDMRPEDLASKQYDELKDATIEILKDIISNLDKDRLDRVSSCLEFSPAGDGYGRDNDFICFDSLGFEDIGQVIKRLKEIKVVIDSSKKNKVEELF